MNIGNNKYSFSGHETFYCKSLWLKKGYDFLADGNSFNDENAVIKLGVGKNMVSSIRFWLRVLGLTDSDKLTKLAHLIFNTEKGFDKYLEDMNSLWLLHYTLVEKKIASLYYLLFVDYQVEKREFDRDTLNNYVRRRCNVLEQKNVYNANTVRKDIGVLLKNYVVPSDLKSIEDFSAIFIPLNLLRENGGVYSFCDSTGTNIDSYIILYALLDIKGDDNTISFDKIQEIASIFSLSISSLVEIIRKLEKKMPRVIHYTENSGIKNVQFLADLDKYDILTKYYSGL